LSALENDPSDELRTPVLLFANALGFRALVLSHVATR